MRARRIVVAVAMAAMLLGSASAVGAQTPDDNDYGLVVEVGGTQQTATPEPVPTLEVAPTVTAAPEPVPTVGVAPATAEPAPPAAGPAAAIGQGGAQASEVFPASSLAATGAQAGVLAALAAGLLAVGGLAVALARRRGRGRPGGRYLISSNFSRTA